MSIEELELPEAGPSKRAEAAYAGLPLLNQPFVLNDALTRTYKAQYSNIYFQRLLQLRKIVADAAGKRWAHVKGSPQLLPNILKVERSKLGYIIGTIYMEMPLKPNILEDLARDNWTAPPPPRPKFYSPNDVIHLEDERGRVTLVGDRLREEIEKPGGGLVTGVVVAALGMETASGDFEVIDLCYAGLPPIAAPASDPSNQIPDKTSTAKGKGKAKQEPVKKVVQEEPMDVDESGDKEPKWVALISGVSAGSAEVPEDLKTQLLVEWLVGEGGGMEDQLDGARVASLILAGNSLSQPVRNEDDRKPKRYGYDASTYTPNPTQTLDAFLTDVLSSGLPVQILPGGEDPVGITLPQQPFPRAMMRNASMGGGEALRMLTNPSWFELNGKSFLGTGGQTLDDIYKYLPTDDRLSMARRTLEWRHIAPTAPDTLWCFPFADKDPFIIERRPHVYFVGNQPEFKTGLVGEPGQRTRIVLLPKFMDTGIVTLVDVTSADLECRTLQIGIPEWDAKKVKIALTQEEIEAERQRSAIVRSDLDMMNEDEGW
ncbi:DNA polymerase delta small subunit Cdc1 [Naganishia albida]|nr:DNA polymerase delta small subunit Cdc1 [Naganishia albida]